MDYSLRLDLLPLRIFLNVEAKTGRKGYNLNILKHKVVVHNST